MTALPRNLTDEVRAQFDLCRDLHSDPGRKFAPPVRDVGFAPQPGHPALDSALPNLHDDPDVDHAR